MSVDPWAALGDGTRREIFARLADRPQSVTDLARDLPVSRPAVSQHLRFLKLADLVQVRSEGRRHVYSVRPEGLSELRAELDSFWSKALMNFKRIAEAEGESTHDRHRQ